MITLRLPSSHPNGPVVQRWATDKESILNTHTKDIGRIQGILKTILTNNPDLGKSS
jgi:hypothetical protein